MSNWEKSKSENEARNGNYRHNPNIGYYDNIRNEQLNNEANRLKGEQNVNSSGGGLSGGNTFVAVIATFVGIVWFFAFLGMILTSPPTHQQENIVLLLSAILLLLVFFMIRKG